MSNHGSNVVSLYPNGLVPTAQPTAGSAEPPAIIASNGMANQTKFTPGQPLYVQDGAPTSTVDRGRLEMSQIRMETGLPPIGEKSMPKSVRLSHASMQN
jgi:hypothetical protein